MSANCSGPDEGQVARAKVLTEDLLEVVRSEHAKAKAVLQQQQMELHQAQAAYAAYSVGYGVRSVSCPLTPRYSGAARSTIVGGL